MLRTTPDGPDEEARAARAASAGSDAQLSRHAIHGFLWMLSTGAAQGVVQIVTLVVLARLLGPTPFGIIGGALIVMRVADIVSKLGVGQALVQRKELDEGHVAAALMFFIGWGALVTVALVEASPLLAGLIGVAELRQVMPLMALGVLASNLSEVSMALLRRELRFRVLAVAQAVSYVVAYGIVAVALALLGFGLWSLAWAFVLQLALKSAVLVILAPPKWSLRATSTALRELLTFGGGMTGWRLANRASKELDNLVVARMLGAEPLGLYRRAYQLSVTPADFFGRSMATIAFPVASKLQEPERLARAYRLVVAGVAIIGLPLGAFLAVVAPELVSVLLGPQWAAASAPLAILSVGLIFHLNQQVIGSIAVATGAVYQTAWRHAVLAVAVVIGALMGQIWGLVGVAFGVLAALMLNYVLMSRLASRLTGLGLGTMLRAHVPGALLTLAVAGAALVTRGAMVGFDLPSPVVLLACAAAAALAAIASLRLWPNRLLGTEGLWWLERVLHALPRRYARLAARLLGAPYKPRAAATA
jgi:O-antigen/teichoic acid export membrane protein